MKRCRSCGKEIGDKDNYCPECGAAQYGDVYDAKSLEAQPVEREDSPAIKNENWPMLLAVIGIGASFLTNGIVGIVMGIISITRDKNKRWIGLAITSIIVGVVMLALQIIAIFYIYPRLEATVREILQSQEEGVLFLK